MIKIIYYQLCNTKAFKLISIILFLLSMIGCVTWDLGKVGYIEPSSNKLDITTKTRVGEECTVIMGEPFIEKALKKANADKLTNVIIMLESETTQSCYRVYADKVELQKEMKK
jgi:hypothetical protein